MYTYNITFVVAPQKEEMMVNYFKDSFIPIIRPSEFENAPMQLKKVVEINGISPEEEAGLSLALSVEIPEEKMAREWYETQLLDALNEFSAKFGEEALFFVTLLKNISI